MTRRPLAILTALALVALAFLVARTEPQEELGFAPFAVRVGLGEVGEGRGLQAVVDDARLADLVRLERWTGTTTGVWLVVDTRMATTENPSLAHATVWVGERHWKASNRPGLGAMHATTLEPGLPQAGAFVFELPREVLEEAGATRAVVRLADSGDTRLITVIEVGLDLTALDHVGELELERTERTRW